MDGVLTVQELWDAVSTQAGDEAPTQDEVIRLLGQLHAADALICDVMPDSQELFRRFRKHERMKLKQRIWTPLAVRFPLFDPEHFLERTYPYLSFLFSWFGLALWVIVVGCGVVLAAVHWSELTRDIVDQALTPQNLVLLWFVYPAVKALHELGHGYAAKYAGGIGIMFLVLMPVPYVDVSSAWGFRDKHKRMLVGAAGIAVELFLGALALFVWLNVESGSAHVIAYNVMLISGISTLLFNGNPLLRFDGYYVLADAIEIPNLGNRSNKYLGYLIQRYLYGSRDAESPADSRGERAQIVIPMGKSMKFLFSSPRLKRNRKRSLGVSALVLTVITMLLFVLPAPFWTRVDGITWPTEQSQVRVGADGFIVRLLAPAGSRVQSGQELIELRDPFLEARVAVLKARQKELKSQLMSAQATDRVQTAVIREELAASARGCSLYPRSRISRIVLYARDSSWPISWKILIL
jgi:putative peptide zinc metalloprotease protein